MENRELESLASAVRSQHSTNWANSPWLPNCATSKFWSHLYNLQHNLLLVNPREKNFLTLGGITSRCKDFRFEILKAQYPLHKTAKLSLTPDPQNDLSPKSPAGGSCEKDNYSPPPPPASLPGAPLESLPAYPQTPNNSLATNSTQGNTHLNA